MSLRWRQLAYRPSRDSWMGDVSHTLRHRGPKAVLSPLGSKELRTGVGLYALTTQNGPSVSTNPGTYNPCKELGIRFVVDLPVRGRIRSCKCDPLDHQTA